MKGHDSRAVPSRKRIGVAFEARDVRTPRRRLNKAQNDQHPDHRIHEASHGPKCAQSATQNTDRVLKYKVWILIRIVSSLGGILYF
jgi:hypothetical protein